MENILMQTKTIAVALAVASLFGCANLKEDLPSPTGRDFIVHPAGWVDTASVLFHGDAIRDAAWDMRQCQTCHGSDYDGGISGESCRTCHSNTAGPENCATCHGSVNPAPPRDLSDNESSSVPGVGAHQIHLLGGNRVSSLELACGQCHVVPASVYVAGHVDSDLPAEVVISEGLATADPTVGTGPPRYNSATITCENTFCHGNWSLEKASSPYSFAYVDSVMTGANPAVLWTGGAEQIECGTCHGTPPAGHIPAELSACGACHSEIVGTDGSIVDQVLHLDGKVNVFNTERGF
jgi:predicted CxxxxCH...CXXCH cytochrome family protein